MRNLAVYPVTAQEIIDVVTNVQAELVDQKKIGSMRPICMRYLLEFTEANKDRLDLFLLEKVLREDDRRG